MVCFVGLPLFGSRRSSYASNSSLDSSFVERMSLMPELDIFPTNRSPNDDNVFPGSPYQAPNEDSVSVQGAVGGTLPFRSRFEFDRCSLPIGYSYKLFTKAYRYSQIIKVPFTML